MSWSSLLAAQCVSGKTNLQYLCPGISHAECSVYGFDTFLSRNIAQTTPVFFDASGSGVVERGFPVIIFFHIVGIEMIAWASEVNTCTPPVSLRNVLAIVFISCLCPKLSSTNQVLDWDHLRMLCRLQKCTAHEFVCKHHCLATASRYRCKPIKGISLCVSSNDSYKCACFLLFSPWGN